MRRSYVARYFEQKDKKLRGAHATRQRNVCYFAARVETTSTVLGPRAAEQVREIGSLTTLGTRYCL